MALFLSVVISGALTAMAVGSPHCRWLGWFTLAALLFSIRILPPIHALACGALWGTSFHLFSVTAVETSVPPGILSLLLLAAVPAVYAYLGAVVTRRAGFSVVFLAFCWIGVEFALKPLALRRGLLAGTESGTDFAHVIESLLGYVWVAFVVVYVNGLLVSILSEIWSRIGQARVVIRSTEPGESLRPLLPLQYARFIVQSCQPRAPPL